MFSYGMHLHGFEIFPFLCHYVFQPLYLFVTFVDNAKYICPPYIHSFFCLDLSWGFSFGGAAWLGYVYLARRLEGGGSFEVDVCIIYGWCDLKLDLKVGS